MINESQYYDEPFEYNPSNDYHPSCGCHPSDRACDFIQGNITKPIEVSKHTKHCEIRADITVKKQRTIRIWGQVKDCNGKPVPCALVKLVKEVQKCNRREFEGVAHGVTDCLGFYQFDICIPDCYEKTRYRVLASKPATGKDLIIRELECEPCKNDCGCIE